MKRASAASDDVEAELDHRFGGAGDIIRRRGPVYNSRECIATRKPHSSLCMRTWAGELRSAHLR